MEEAVEHEQARREVQTQHNRNCSGQSHWRCGYNIGARKAAAQTTSGSMLRTVLDRGKLIVGPAARTHPGTSRTRRASSSEWISPWPASSQRVVRGHEKVEFVRQDPAQRIPTLQQARWILLFSS